MRKILVSTLLIITISQYSRIDAVRYARENVYNIQHTCGNLSDSYLKCNPYAYFGKDYCGYKGDGDCANYVSQCLVYGGGHEFLKDTEHCRGYPCGFEEPGARNLGFCLQEKGWNSTCGKYLGPPSYIEPGDVLIYHEKGCDLNPAHAVIITEVGDNVNVTGRSKSMIDEIYSYNTEKPYYQWLHYIDPEEYIFKIEKIKIGFSPCGDSIGKYSFYIYGEFNKEVDISETLNLNLTTSFDKKIETTCTPYYFDNIKLHFFICDINICVYPLDNTDIFLPIKAPNSIKYGFRNWEKIIGSNPGVTNKISGVTCLPKEINTFIPSSIKEEGCNDKKIIFSIYGKWKDTDESKIPFFLEFPLLIQNENIYIANCEYEPINPIHMKCEFEGSGIIKFDELYCIEFLRIFKIESFSSSNQINECSIEKNPLLSSSSLYINFNIIFTIILSML